jgi:hypothetical protein
MEGDESTVISGFSCQRTADTSAPKAIAALVNKTIPKLVPKRIGVLTA